MKLNLNVADVEISTGKMFHLRDEVYIQFRRSPDIDVINDIFSLKSAYGWEVEDMRQKGKIERMLNDDADFVIHCTGCESHEVGNSIAAYLRENHHLSVRFLQRITYKEGFSQIREVSQLVLDGRMLEE